MVSDEITTSSAAFACSQILGYSHSVAGKWAVRKAEVTEELKIELKEEGFVCV